MVEEQIHFSKQDSSISDKIFEKARSLFFSAGVRNTTMDDIAKELGISKKTLYKEFETKADLVRFCVEHELKQSEETFQSISKKTTNAIEELLQIVAHNKEELQQFHTSIMHDLMKHFQDSWMLIEQHRDVFAKKFIVHNLQNGIKQGLYRKDLNIDIVTLLHLHLSFFPLQYDGKGYPISEIYFEVMRYNLYAIATPKGIEQFEQLIKKIKL
ncbi:MAG: hypothetical protein RJA25_480 [Bacteroidota bacterium]|jgi:AcrR family transcriptional regulator